MTSPRARPSGGAALSTPGPEDRLRQDLQDHHQGDQKKRRCEQEHHQRPAGDPTNQQEPVKRQTRVHNDKRRDEGTFGRRKHRDAQEDERAERKEPKDRLDVVLVAAGVKPLLRPRPQPDLPEPVPSGFSSASTASTSDGSAAGSPLSNTPTSSESRAGSSVSGSRTSDGPLASSSCPSSAAAGAGAGSRARGSSMGKSDIVCRAGIFRTGSVHGRIYYQVIARRLLPPGPRGGRVDHPRRAT